MSENLLPCPFCGSANVDPDGWASQHTSGPACDDCGASAGGAMQSREENVAAWNTRHDSTERTAREAAEAAVARMEGELAGLREIESLLVAWIEEDEVRSAKWQRHRSDAPGHSHAKAGIWDDDNGVLAGKPCMKCALWRKARELRALLEGRRYSEDEHG